MKHKELTQQIIDAAYRVHKILGYGFNEVHEIQLVDYLKGTGIEVGLLINFGLSVQVKRKVFTAIEA